MSKEKKQPFETTLDHLSRDVVRSGGIGEEQADAIAASPFFYARLRARIAADQAPQPDGLFDLLTLAWRTIPAMAIVAVVAVGLFMFAGPKPSSSGPPVIIPVSSPANLAPATACSISSNNGCAVSENDVLATMFAEQEGKAQQ